MASLATRSLPRSLSRSASAAIVTPKRYLTVESKKSDSPAQPPQVLQQAPNRATTWSETQRPRAAAMKGPRFEQTDFSVQPNPPSAQELIAAVPVKFVEGRRVACDGGGGALGHPKVYINLDGLEPESCGYCGLRFQQKHHH